MKRTTVMLPADLKSEVARRAQKRGISLGQLIRESLEENLKRPAASGREDSLLSDDVIFSGRVPRNLSQHHDEYLYGKDA